MFRIKCAIFSAVWATSAGFTIAADEITQVRTASHGALQMYTIKPNYSIFQICAAAGNPASIMGKNLQIAGGTFSWRL